MSNKESIGGEQAYETALAEIIADEDARYQKFLAYLLGNEVV